MQELKSIFPKYYSSYRYFILHSIRHQKDIALARKAAEEMKQHNIDDSFDMRLIFEAAVSINPSEALSMWKSALEAGGLENVSPHMAAVALQLLRDSDPALCDAIMSMY